MKYSDPDKDTLQNTVKDIIQSKSIQDVFDLLHKIYPGFVINKLDEYSTDYPHFDKNWRAMCLSLKTRKASIVLVDDFEQDDEHILVKTFCEILTQSGFIVRKYTEFFPCSQCNSAIPNEEIYDKLKEANIKTPDKWSKSCVICKMV